MRVAASYTSGMKTSLRTGAAALVTLAFLAVPAAASADTMSDLQAQIQSLMSQLKALQEQLHQELASTSPSGGWMIASTTIPRWGDEAHGASAAPGQWHMGSSTPCIALSRSLAQGAFGDDVRELQQKLIDEGDLDESAGVTGFFGPLTAAAVHKMQAHFGIASTTGTVGPMTRRFLRKGCEDVSQDDKPGMSGRVGDMIMHAFSSTTIPLQLGFGAHRDSQQPEVSGAAAGSITSIDDTRISVSDASGASKTFAITATTMVRIYDASSGTMKDGTVASLAAGDTVLVHGMKTADGSISAILIQKGLPGISPRMMHEGASTTPPIHGNEDVLKMLQGFIQGGDNLGR